MAETINRVSEWVVEWSPTPSNAWNWQTKTICKTHGDAVTEVKRLLRDNIHDSEPSHWRISGYHN